MAYNTALIWRDEGKLYIKIKYANGTEERGQLPADINRKQLAELCKRRGVEPQHVEIKDG